MRRAVLLLALALSPHLSKGQEISLVEGPDCLPNENNGMAFARVEGDRAGDQVRLYFRRLDPVGPFYWARMEFDGERYWAVFPRPETRNAPELTDEWWDVLADRDWLEGNDRDWLEEFLEDQKHEAVEYFVAIHDGTGERRAKSSTRLVGVLDSDHCRTSLTPGAIPHATSLIVGETTEIQAGRPVFHFLCNGIVTRIDTSGVLRADEFCRACVVSAEDDPSSKGKKKKGR